MLGASIGRLGRLIGRRWDLLVSVAAGEGVKCGGSTFVAWRFGRPYLFAIKSQSQDAGEYNTDQQAEFDVV